MSRFATAIRMCIGAILATVLGILAVNWIFEWSDDQGGNEDVAGFEGSYVSSVFESIRLGQSIDEGMRSVGLLDLDANEAPDWLSCEVVDISKAASAFSNADASILGLSYDGDGSASVEGILAELSCRGWLRIESGYKRACTLIKEEGECRWMMFDARDTGQGLDVVMHIRRI